MHLFSLLSLLALSSSVSSSPSEDSLPNFGNDPRLEMEMWHDFWRWRWEQERKREHGHGRGNRRPDRDSDYDTDHDDSKRGRRRNHGDRERIGKPPIKIPIHPSFPPMPTIIEPYPTPLPSTTSSLYVAPSTRLASSVYHSAPSSATLSSIVYTTTPPAKKQYYRPTSNSTSSTQIHYDSTTIKTVPASTVKTSVTGRYRAMSNSAAHSSSSTAGTISFALIILSSVVLLVLV